MDVKVIAPALRITMALTIVATMIAAGWLHRPPWMVALATPAFTVLYALGKWTAWSLAWRLGGGKKIAGAALAAIPIQAIVAGVLYLVGVGAGRLVMGWMPVKALSGLDVMTVGLLLAVGVVVCATIIRLESMPTKPTDRRPSAAIEEPELDIDPGPVTHETFFKSPGYWRVNASQRALETRGAPVEKASLAAREDMIVAAETRLGVRLPDTLRKLYGIMNGGYVGWLFVPLKPNPKPTHADWRGAFAIDYSSLAPLEKLRTVAEHYQDFTHEPEEVPANADRLIILQARYCDMTLLDYSRRPQPHVVIVDYDKQDKEPVDIIFETFDAFFAALRRTRDRNTGTCPRRRNLSRPLDEGPEADRSRSFWGVSGPHPFYTNATHRKDGSEPKLTADDVLITETEARLGVKLPPSLVTLWRAKNGGGVCSRFVQMTRNEAVEDFESMRFPVPLEYVVSLADLSDRIMFPPGEVP